jgi:hypothetical protein
MTRPKSVFLREFTTRYVSFFSTSHTTPFKPFPAHRVARIWAFPSGKAFQDQGRKILFVFRCEVFPFQK